MMPDQPFVSIVTPLFNMAAYLPECIEGVLAQTYGNFEWVIVDNQSTDGSYELAARHAATDSRIRLVRNPKFLDMLSNFNEALAQASPAAKYVKYALADDVLFPECVARLVEVAEKEPTAGMVGSYYLFGEELGGAGVPRGQRVLAGREACRLMLRGGKFMVGSPTSVLYRAGVVRARRPCFRPGRLHADTELAYEVLLEHDLGFVHQVLSFIRTDNVSFTTSTQAFHPNLLDRLIVLELYGAKVFGPEEFSRLRADVRRAYFRFLGRASLRRKPPRFWEYHRAGLASVGITLRPGALVPWALGAMVRLALDPLTTVPLVAREVRKRLAGASGDLGRAGG